MEQAARRVMDLRLCCLAVFVRMSRGPGVFSISQWKSGWIPWLRRAPRAVPQLKMIMRC